MATQMPSSSAMVAKLQATNKVTSRSLAPWGESQIPPAKAWDSG